MIELNIVATVVCDDPKCTAGIAGSRNTRALSIDSGVGRPCILSQTRLKAARISRFTRLSILAWLS